VVVVYCRDCEGRFTVTPRFSGFGELEPPRA
jgi:hypothetical protein